MLYREREQEKTVAARRVNEEAGDQLLVAQRCGTDRPRRTGRGEGMGDPLGMIELCHLDVVRQSERLGSRSRSTGRLTSHVVSNRVQSDAVGPV